MRRHFKPTRMFSNASLLRPGGPLLPPSSNPLVGLRPRTFALTQSGKGCALLIDES